jgi:RNA polymerase subunit RPABC4/transcription elongation factor Spt4
MPFNLEDTGGLFTGLLVYGGMTLAAFWLAMIIWTYRDMRARSRDPIAQLLVGLLVAVLTIPGLLIYLFLRPRETLSDAYERSLEEEALLQEIEEKPVCPGCKQRVQVEWQACPHCHTRLKKPCTRCGRMLELAWELCPYCASAQPNFAAERVATGHVRQADQWATQPTYEPRSRAARRSEPIEFVEGDEG